MSEPKYEDFEDRLDYFRCHDKWLAGQNNALAAEVERLERGWGDALAQWNKSELAVIAERDSWRRVAEKLEEEKQALAERLH